MSTMLEMQRASIEGDVFAVLYLLGEWLSKEVERGIGLTFWAVLDLRVHPGKTYEKPLSKDKPEFESQMFKNTQGLYFMVTQTDCLTMYRNDDEPAFNPLLAWD